MTQAQNTAISMKILQQMLNNFDLNFTSDYAVSFEPEPILSNLLDLLYAYKYTLHRRLYMSGTLPASGRDCHGFHQH